MQPPPIDSSPWLTVAQVARQMNIAERTVRELCADGELTHLRMGARSPYRIQQSEVDRYIRHHLIRRTTR